MTRLFCFFLGHALIRQRQTVDGIPNVLGYRCLRCQTWVPAIRRSAAEHASIKRLGIVRRLKVTKAGNVREFRKVAR